MIRLILFLILVIFPLAVHAQTDVFSLSLKPTVFDLELSPDEEYQATVILINNNDYIVPISISLTDFTEEEPSGKIRFEGIQGETFSPSRWIIFEDTYFFLGPQEKKEIDFTITVPRNAEPGSHTSLLLFEPRLPSFYFKEGSRVIGIVSLPFIISIDDEGIEREKDPLALKRFEIPGITKIKIPRINTFIFDGVPQEVGLTLENRSIWRTKSGITLKIFSQDGILVGEALKRITFLPGKEKEILLGLEQKESGRLLFRKFGMDVTIISEGSNQKITKTLNFFAFPLKLGLLTGFISLTLIFVVLFRKRLKLSILVFFRTLFRR